MAKVPLKIFCILAIKLYDETTDTMDHVELFSSHMLVQVAIDVVECKAFSTTLEEHKRTWYLNLPYWLIS